MKTIVFDPKEHLSSSDQRILDDYLSEHGVTTDELLEFAVKKEIYSQASVPTKAKESSLDR